MNAPIDHALIQELLADESLSYREIARRAGCSDWTVRDIARRLVGDERPMKRLPSHEVGEPMGFAGWATLAGITVALALMLWWASRSTPPQSNP